MSVNCKDVQDKIAGYVDHEIAPSAASAITQHLDDCPGCAEEANAQKHVKELVQDHAKSVCAPAHLRARVQRAIERYSPGFGFWRQLQDLWRWQLIPTIATAMILMLLSGIVTHFASGVMTNRSLSEAAVVEGRLEGEIICVDCELLKLTNTDYDHDASHRIGLRCNDGYLWGLLPSDKSRQMIQQAAGRHRHVRVEGQLFPRMHYVQVKEFSLI
jgi:anti-sigma factor (TIGR02949 family)